KFSKYFAPCGFRREAFYPCYGMAESTLIVTGGFKSAMPAIRAFDGRALENNQVVDVVSDEENARELVGCGGALLDQKVVIADNNATSRRSSKPFAAPSPASMSYRSRQSRSSRRARSPKRPAEKCSVTPAGKDFLTARWKSSASGEPGPIRRPRRASPRSSGQ